MPLTHAHFQAKATPAQFKAAVASGYFDWLKNLLTQVAAFETTEAVALEKKTIADVQAGDWFSVGEDAWLLVKMIQATSPIETATE